MSDLRPALLKSQVSAVRRKHPAAQVVALRSRSRWDGSPQLRIGDEDFTVAQCDSELAMREAMLAAQDAETALVILTDLSEVDLAGDVLARFARRRVLRMDVLDALRDLFSANKIDPRVRKYQWVADSLLENVPSDGYRPSPNGVLTAEHLWSEFLRVQLGFGTGRPDAREVLRWTQEPAHVDLCTALAQDRLEDVVRWIRDAAGELGAFLVQAAIQGRAALLPACGLCCEAIFAEQSPADSSVRDAAIRLEKYTGDRPVPRSLGQQWAKCALEWMRSLPAHGEAEQAEQTKQALDKLIVELGISDSAWLSSLSRMGFEQRMLRFGQSLQSSLSKKKDYSGELWGLAENAAKHTAAGSEPERIDRLRMACRLRAWLDSSGDATSDETHLPCLVKDYLVETGFVDWARNALYAGDGCEAVAKAYSKLLEKAGAIREKQNEVFGQSLVAWTEEDSRSSGVLGVEDILAEVVTGIAGLSPVLLIVLDGMSVAVFRELIEDLVLTRRWVELWPEGKEWPQPALAVLPSVTEVSRRALFAGTLDFSAGGDEARAFAAHPQLREICGAAHPLLFCKSDIMDLSGAELREDLREELRSARRKVIGVVVNAVDDHLLKGDQITFPWKTSHVPVLDKLLYAAREAGRTVVLTSDHGHIIDHQTKARMHDAGERYRMVNDDVKPDECIASGRRVLKGNGRIIAPWSENVRYGPKKNGYHGGITPQEMVVPLAVLGTDASIPEWTAKPLLQPDWWREPAAPRPGQRPLASATPAPIEQEPLPLFTKVAQAVEADKANWIACLLASKMMAAQKDLAGRAAPSDEKLRSFLHALDSQGGTLLLPALAQRIGQPPLRIRGIVSAMQRLLNVEGYEVLSHDPSSGTVSLNYELLRRQFELEP